jgi:hypothetical protein
MNFKKWIALTEAGAGGNTRNRPTSQSNVDRSSLYGLAAQYGHSGTQVPISFGLNNKATTSFLAGIGSGIDKAQRDSGFEPAPAPQIQEFPISNKTYTESGYLPLQLPYILATRETLPGFKLSGLASHEADLSKQVFNFVRDPESDERVRKPGENPKDTNKFASLESMGRSATDLYGNAKNFTRALIKIMIINRMFEKNLNTKYDLSKGRLGKEHVEDGNLVCVFYFEPMKTADQEEVEE